jgi:hypothetical protein
MRSNQSTTKPTNQTPPCTTFVSQFFSLPPATSSIFLYPSLAYFCHNLSTKFSLFPPMSPISSDQAPANIDAPSLGHPLAGDTTGRASCGIIRVVNETERSDTAPARSMEQSRSGHWIGLRGRLARPFWGWLGGWAVLCGVLASNQFRWEGEALRDLALVLLLVELGWGSLWDLAVGTAWFRPLAEGWPPTTAKPVAALPYTQPNALGGRLARWLGRLSIWWREAFWPAAGPALLAVLAAALLTVVLTLLLPDRIRPLYAALIALVGLGLVQRRRGKDPLAAQALVRVGLSWLAGHAVFGPVGPTSIILALAFALAAWGDLRVAAGLPRGLWSLNAGQVVAIALLLVLRQPVAAGVAGLFLFGQVAMQPSLRYAVEPDVSRERYAIVSRRTWPWLMAAMLVVALALP